MKTYNELLADYNYLIQHHNADICSSINTSSHNELYLKLLSNPTEKQAYEQLHSLIKQSSEHGFITNNGLRKCLILKMPGLYKSILIMNV